jgi:hypothetical protein
MCEACRRPGPARSADFIAELQEYDAVDAIANEAPCRAESGDTAADDQDTRPFVASTSKARKSAIPPAVGEGVLSVDEASRDTLRAARATARGAEGCRDTACGDGLQQLPTTGRAAAVHDPSSAS